MHSCVPHLSSFAKQYENDEFFLEKRVINDDYGIVKSVHSVEPSYDVFRCSSVKVLAKPVKMLVPVVNFNEDDLGLSAVKGMMIMELR